VTNPLGARLDYQIRKEGIREDARPFMANPNVNRDWNGVWEVKSAILANGWSSEIAIPLFSLRFNEHPAGGWGLNILRNVRRKNEESTWAPLPRNLKFHKISLAGTLLGLDELEKKLNLQIKPYTIADRIHERNDEGVLTSDNTIDGGFDVKYGLTSNLTAEFTVNTDFSQVEADDQQINLTRFSLYYPEKREFFLENAAIFSVGAPEDAMIFFSRRIGLQGEDDDIQEIPLLGGVKVAGKAGRYNLGLISLQSKAKGDIPSNNYTVARLSRDILKQSAIGLIVTNRQSSESGDYNRAVAVDGDFSLGTNLS
jgi:D-alanine-D-alanine ligase-like ATP-grasp enzyme